MAALLQQVHALCDTCDWLTQHTMRIDVDPKTARWGEYEWTCNVCGGTSGVEMDDDGGPDVDLMIPLEMVGDERLGSEESEAIWREDNNRR